MDDTLKNLGLGFLAFFLLHGALQNRARHAAERQVREAFRQTGTVRADVTPRGLFGLVSSDIWAVDIYGDGIKTERLPFAAYPRPGWKGSIRHLRLHFQNFLLAGLPVEKFESDIPFVTFDIGHAINRNYLQVREAGHGPATVQVGAEGLRVFILRKYARTLSDVDVAIQPERVIIRGKLKAFGQAFTATGKLVPRAGRYVDLTDPQITLGGKPLTPDSAELITRQINPVLDAEDDLGLGGYFTITRVEVGGGELIVYGEATIPPAK